MVIKVNERSLNMFIIYNRCLLINALPDPVFKYFLKSSTVFSFCCEDPAFTLERVSRIELPSLAWKASIMNHYTTPASG